MAPMKTADWKVELNMNDKVNANSCRAHCSSWIRTHRCFFAKSSNYNDLKAYAMTHPVLRPFAAKFSAPRTRQDPHYRFHQALEAFLQDCQKKVREGMRKTGDNLGEEIEYEEETLAGPSTIVAPTASPLPTNPKKPVRFLILDPELAGVGPAPRPWDAAGTRVILGVVEFYTLVELYNIASRDLPAGRHIRTLYGALADPPFGSTNGRPSDANIIELFDDQQVGAWLAMSTATPLTCCAELSRTSDVPDTPLASGHEFLNWLDYTGPRMIDDPAEESDRDIRPPKSRARKMPKTRKEMEARMANIRKRIRRQETLLKRIKVHARARFGPENVLESDEEDWLPNMTPAHQVLVKTRNQARSDAAWAAGPQVAAAQAAGTPVPPNPLPFGPVGINRPEREWERQEKIVRRIQKAYLAAHPERRF